MPGVDQEVHSRGSIPGASAAPSSRSRSAPGLHQTTLPSMPRAPIYISPPPPPH